MAKALFVISPGMFRDEELFHTKEELEDAGIETHIASLRKGEFMGRLGGRAVADISVSEAIAANYDVVIFVGGPGVTQHGLPENPAVLKLAKDANSKCKVLAAICAGPKILAAAGVVKGKKVTVFPDEGYIALIKKMGGNYTASHLEVDNKLVTADGPEAAHDFGRKIAELLS
ncbi:Intracellular protease 1 [Candidatus Gugararchaeum adminiculabundum]|nr:Intracellular protease 1 [Candidatus Gugararchaeum adminiculabundum]